MKISKKQFTILITGLVLVLAIGIGIWAINEYRVEQARLEAQRIEANNKSITMKAVKETHDRLFKRLNAITPTSGSFTQDEFLNSPGGDYISDEVKQQLMANKDNKARGVLLGCRTRFSEKLTAEGYTYGVPEKKNDKVYTVSISWKGDPEDSSDKPSRGVVNVDVEKKKIVKFDCSEQDAINNELKIQADVESSRR